MNFDVTKHKFELTNRKLKYSKVHLSQRIGRQNSLTDLVRNQ